MRGLVRDGLEIPLRGITLGSMEQSTSKIEPGEVRPAEPDSKGTEVLRAVRIRKGFRQGIPPFRKRTDVLRGADLEIGRGEMVGLVGENGSGKSTLMKIIVGMLERDGGTVELDGRFGYCPQLPLLWSKLTVDEHFELFSSAYDLDESEAKASAAALADELQFDRYRSYRAEELSGGTRQKLNLAISMLHNPELLLLDEPYSGFDWETYTRFWKMSERLRDEGMAILIVSHFLPERDRLDRIYELRDGKSEET